MGSSFAFDLAQRRAGCLQVVAILHRLEQRDVLDWNHSHQRTTATRQQHPILAVGHAVDESEKFWRAATVVMAWLPDFLVARIGNMLRR